jgi:hypothetical protein
MNGFKNLIKNENECFQISFCLKMTGLKNLKRKLKMNGEMVLLNGTLLHTADLLFKSVTLWTGAWESESGWGLGVPKLTKKHSKDVKSM